MAVEQAYLPFDYALWAVLVAVTMYFFVQLYNTRKELIESNMGGAIGDAATYIVWGSGFLVIHALYEFAPIHYDQAWFVAKFLSIAPQVFGLTLMFYGVFEVFRTLDII